MIVGAFSCMLLFGGNARDRIFRLKIEEGIVSEIAVLVTVQSEDEGIALGKALVEDNLVACVNVVPTIQSIFKWEGATEVQSESLLILKSTDARFDALETAIKSRHSYSVPEIIAFPIVRGSEDYLSWVREITLPSESESAGL